MAKGTGMKKIVQSSKVPMHKKLAVGLKAKAPKVAKKPIGY